MKRLKELVALHKGQNWLQISLDLGTNRPPSFIFRQFMRHCIVRPQRTWERHDTDRLIALAERLGPRWTEISLMFPGFTVDQIKSRYRVVNPKFKKGRWSPDENSLLLGAVKLYKASYSELRNDKVDSALPWKEISLFVPTRSDVQCRHHYRDVLMPGRNREPLTAVDRQRLYNIVEEIKQTNKIDGQLVSEVTTVKPGSRNPIPWNYISEHYFGGRIETALRQAYRAETKRRDEKRVDD